MCHVPCVMCHVPFVSCLVVLVFFLSPSFRVQRGISLSLLFLPSGPHAPNLPVGFLPFKSAAFVCAQHQPTALRQLPQRYPQRCSQLGTGRPPPSQPRPH